MHSAPRSCQQQYSEIKTFLNHCTLRHFGEYFAYVHVYQIDELDEMGYTLCTVDWLQHLKCVRI